MSTQKGSDPQKKVFEQNFDPELRPDHPTNQEAAKVRGLTFSHGRRSYVDEDDSSIADQFGQRY